MKKTICILIAIAMTLAVGFALTGCGDPEKQKAEDAFTEETELLQAQIDARTTEVEKAQSMLAEKKDALDETIQPKLEQAVDSAVNDKAVIPEMPKKTEEINAKTGEMKAWEESLATQTNTMKDLEQKLDKSRKQYAQISSPKEEFVVERLKNVKDIDKVKAVTEDNDPNGMLGKQGGYKAQVYFSSPLVKDEYGTLTGDVIEDGTDGGGSVEVYETVSEAKTRDDYLGSFDGQGALSSGSHHVYGTIIIRTSNKLTASQQEKLEKRILKSLTKLDEDN